MIYAIIMKANIRTRAIPTWMNEAKMMKAITGRRKYDIRISFFRTLNPPFSA